MTINPPFDGLLATSLPAIREAFSAQRNAFLSKQAPKKAQRLHNLNGLLHILEKHGEEFADAICADFGHRSRHESMMLDVGMTIGDIKDLRRHFARWMKPRRVGMRRHLLPASAQLRPQPLGVVGVISPWNFPVYLTFTGVAAALAAGNRVMIKPSEITPRTSALIARTISEAFEPEEVCVVLGGAEQAGVFASLPFDHLLFTGSTAVGRHVAQAAAANLTPVTLELGGKSPAILGRRAEVQHAAQRIVYGKLLNAGQICVSPDYALIPRDKLEVFIEAACKAATHLYPSFANNDDYSSIVTPRHFARLNRLIDDAVERGNRIVRIEPEVPIHGDGRKMALTLIIEPRDEMMVMQEEIFGPILPVIPYDSLEEAIEFVNRRDRPLALYLFTTDAGEREQVLNRTTSGGVTVNDTLWHVACDSLPFGGVGASGMGAYHGKQGFETFSHMKPVFFQARVNATALLRPPYGRVTEWTAAFLRWFM